MKPPCVMVVEDQAAMRDLLQEYLEQHGFRVECFPDAGVALQRLGLESVAEADSFQFPGSGETPKQPRSGGPEPAQYDAVLTDIKMPGVDGIQFCQVLNQYRPTLPVIVMTAYGSMETSVQALRAGAFDFVTKPVEMELLKASLVRATENSRLRRQIRSLEAHSALHQFDQLIGESDAVRKLKDQLSRVVSSSASVLLTGESGSGKEVAARALHGQSDRASKPFVAVNCAALPESLIESELFGHVKGAFTDAREDRDGLFIQADGGTLFLDEIGELPIEMQPKLLRCLEQKTVRPVGGKQEQAFDVRLITATNRDLETEVEAKRFREDLYYRINVLEITVPSLRTRGTDVLMLANHFLAHFSAQTGRPVRRFDENAARKLLAYDWPGNVRELRNVVERGEVLSQSELITLEELPDKIVNYRSSQLVIGDHDNQPLAPLDVIELQYIQYVLRQAGGNKTEAAKILGLDRKTLYRKLKEIESE
ncbi:MAG: sigma-54 dependent transcriptional regulator [Planctomycetota bacterium]|nr:sigma-54 dependent transcriptional regulator [Planctomycetota bacterium]